MVELRELQPGDKFILNGSEYSVIVPGPGTVNVLCLHCNTSTSLSGCRIVEKVMTFDLRTT